jgi:hypothetical protein
MKEKKKPLEVRTNRAPKEAAAETKQITQRERKSRLFDEPHQQQK